jgi:hypothetical protein
MSRSLSYVGADVGLINGSGKSAQLISRGVGGDRSIRLGTMAKTGLTPPVENSVDQVVRDGMVLGDVLMTLFAFPRALKNPCYLFKYSGHFMFDGNLVPTPFNSLAR